ncbi:hypothetical protein EKO04_006728 [Ascochyta lentis]|uniref:Uncharacterized protein n=1 Tax=Ascochyta lentis TaxID=205686 RepID=A0A8H7MHE4_9PLEO|nr:hypothetical protein EKO04_006728 [Ascochyta lentis]
MPHHKNLAIYPAPFKSSHLSIPPSPFSPRSPLTPASKSQSQQRAACTSTATVSSPTLAPNSPLHWVWTCHACTRVYPLGTTRRCLDDGHHFCAGITSVKSQRKDGSRKRVRKHRACVSEFDYLGWKNWGRWRRSNSHNAGKRVVGKPVKSLVLGSGKEKNCWINCDYPSQCRWGKQVGVHTPTPTRTEFSISTPIPSSSETWTLNTPMTDMPTLDDCFAAEGNVPDEERSGAHGRFLEASAKRRKSISLTPTSHLSDVSAPDIEMQDAFPTSENHTSCIDPSLLVLTNPIYTYSSPSTSHPKPPTSTSPLTAKAAATLEKIKALLSNHKILSPRQTNFPPVAKQQQGSRRRRTTPAPTATVAREQDVDSEGLVDEFSALEKVARWNEGAVHVS